MRRAEQMESLFMIFLVCLLFEQETAYEYLTYSQHHDIKEHNLVHYISSKADSFADEAGGGRFPPRSQYRPPETKPRLSPRQSSQEGRQVYGPLLVAAMG